MVGFIVRLQEKSATLTTVSPADNLRKSTISPLRPLDCIRRITIYLVWGLGKLTVVHELLATQIVSPLQSRSKFKENYTACSRGKSDEPKYE